MKKILIVEDDQYFREALRDLLKKKMIVLEAPNGRSAKEILSVQDVDIVLSDIQMPGFSGLDLLEWSRQYKPVPFIIMTGFSMVLETKSAFDLGAKGFIAKPFKNSDLLTTIDSILGEEKEEPKFSVEEASKDYCKVSIDEFVAKPKIEFDVYVKLSESKYIKIAYKGQEIQRDKVEHYKEKGVRYLYILREDFSKLVEFNLDLAKIMKDRPNISAEKKINFLKYTGEVILEKTFVEGLDKAALYEAKSFLEITLNAISEAPESFDLLTMLNTHSDHVYAHSLGVSLYSVMMAKQMGVESNVSLFKLSMAGLYHDIGKKEIDRELLEKPRHLVSKEERKIIEGHVVRGQDILSAMVSVPADVIQMVFEHHEDQEGLGYPMGKVKIELHPMSRILQCANLFIENTIANPQGASRSAPSAISHIEKIYGGRIDPDCIKALKKIFNISK